MERLRAYWASGWMGKVVLGAAGLFGLLLLCCIVLVALVPSRSAVAPSPVPATTAQPAAAVQATVAPAATQPPAPTEVPKPTATSAPTDTPAPTNTPAPTATPEPTATPTPPPEPVVLKGKGKTVTDPFTLPDTVNWVKLTHKGKSNFIVHAFGPNDQEESITNDIGNYTGVRPLLGKGEWFFEVNADGVWEIRVEPMGPDPDAATGIEGHGDYVSGLFLPAKTGRVPYNIKHTGQSNFIVHLLCAGGSDSVANEIGAVEGSVVVKFQDGPCFWEVRADGDWSIKPK